MDPRVNAQLRALDDQNHVATLFLHDCIEAYLESEWEVGVRPDDLTLAIEAVTDLRGWCLGTMKQLLKDTVCVCNHWYKEHAEIEGPCEACGCLGFLYHPELNTPGAIANRGGEHE